MPADRSSLLHALLQLLQTLPGPVSISVHHEHGSAQFQLPPAASPPASPAPARTHSPDFRSVRWDGQSYTFTAGQAAVVRLLWESWQNGTPEMGGEALLELSGSESTRLVDLFRDHPAWGSLIRPGQSRGAYRLG